MRIDSNLHGNSNLEPPAEMDVRAAKAPASWAEGVARQLGVAPEQVEPAFYQAPGTYVSDIRGVPDDGTHVGMTEAAGRANGFSDSFTQAVAAHNANTDANQYDNDAAHAYNFSREATLARAAELGQEVKAATDALSSATTDAARRAATGRLAEAFGQYEHLVQDNQAHGGTDRAQHYGANVDENAASIAAGQREARDTFTELGAYLRSRGIDPNTLDAGPPPEVEGPPAWDAFTDKTFAPPWDGVDRMWDRSDMAARIREQFNSRLHMGGAP
jgi:hypothetical protein